MIQPTVEVEAADPQSLSIFADLEGLTMRTVEYGFERLMNDHGEEFATSRKGFGEPAQPKKESRGLLPSMENRHPSCAA